MVSLIRNSCIVVLVSIGFGMIANTVSSRGIPLMGPVPQPPNTEGVKRIALEEAYRLFRERRSVFVDARSEEEFRAGHIPGAHFLNHDNFEESVSTFRDLIPSDTVLVTYCSGEGCGSSREVAELLHEEGFSDIRLFSGGWDRWKQKGYPEEPGRAPSPEWFEDF